MVSSSKNEDWMEKLLSTIMGEEGDVETRVAVVVRLSSGNTRGTDSISAGVKSHTGQEGRIGKMPVRLGIEEIVSSGVVTFQDSILLFFVAAADRDNKSSTSARDAAVFRTTNGLGSLKSPSDIV